MRRGRGESATHDGREATEQFQGPKPDRRPPLLRIHQSEMAQGGLVQSGLHRSHYDGARQQASAGRAKTAAAPRVSSLKAQPARAARRGGNGGRAAKHALLRERGLEKGENGAAGVN
jgi:hypothetical protein